MKSEAPQTTKRSGKMADGVQRSFENLSLNRGQQQPQQQQTSQQLPHLGLHSPSNGTISSQASSSLRSPSGTYGNAQLHGSNVNDGQSAAARFERFFNTGGSPSPQGFDAGMQGGGFHQASPASLGPGSSAAGLASSGAFGSFGHTFNSGGGSAGFGNNSTVPALRSKPTGARQGIPSQWGTGAQDDLGGGAGMGPGSSPPQQFGVPGFLSAPSSSAYQGVGSTGAPAPSGLDDDIIPTAIVVKNIPFSIKREQLLQIIEDLQIPMPYAFNYHFDQGVFRGLAFANFRSGEEADAVVAALNGFDVSGRKLRVEYKKVLQAGEKERIEKEKAIKRMQSMQMEKERMRRQTVTSDSNESWNAAQLAGAPPTSSTASTAVGKPSMAPGIEMDSGYGDAFGGDAQQSPDLLRSTVESQTDLAAGAATELGGRKEELDLNDPATLEIYSRVLLFKDDRMRDELSFSRNLTTNERRIVHMVSKKLNLYHYSIGESEERYVIVTKNEVNHAQRPLRSQASTIGRSHRGGDGSGFGGGSSGLLSPGSSYTIGRNALRTKKSAPDMKRQRERSDDGAFGSAYSFGFNNISTGGHQHGSYPAGLSRKSNGNLREGYSASVGRRSTPTGAIGGAAGLQSLFSSPFDIPPVPSLPVTTPDGISHSSSPSPIGASSIGQHSNNGSLSAASSQHILRQPAGPGAANRNFAQRSRVPIGAAANGQSGGYEDAASSNGMPELNGSLHSQPDRMGGPGELRDDDVQTHQPLEV